MDWRKALISGTTVIVIVWLSLRRKRLNLPPPIPGLPLVGNTLQLLNLTHVQLDEWKNKHGPIYSLNTLGGIVVVVANAAIASDILDKMSAVTSSRPDSIMASELMTRSNIIITLKYGGKWRRHHRGVHESLRSPELFYSVQEHESRILVDDLIAGGFKSDLKLNFRRTSASTIWRGMYGGPSLKSDDRTLSEVSDLADQIIAVLGPGRSIVDVIPPLKYLPAGLSPFKRYANDFFARTNAFLIGLADQAIKRKLIDDDPSKFNVCALLNERKEALGLSDEDIAWITGSMFLGGTETSSTTLHYFVLAMVLHPDVCRKAHKELDTEVGGRPPTFSDRDRLPYVEAIVKEVLRWRPVVAIGAPHVATKEFSYQGYTIPKDTIILNNMWSITHDDALFENPDAFMPERFLDELKAREPNMRYDDLTFGYGRRICSGRHVAVNFLFITTAHLLWAFEFHKAVDSKGKEITPSMIEFHDTGGTIQPKPFPFNLIVRRAQAGSVIDSSHDS